MIKIDSNGNNFVDDINSYYKLSVKSNINDEELWIKKLRSILNTDIHENSLGCRINDTHVKIGDIHMGSFFEARFMFSQQKWIIRFADWLKKQFNIENSQGVLIIGYETYLEPVLSYLKLNFADKLEYCIYEVEKHLAADPKSKTDTRIRYLENVVKSIKNKNFKADRLIFLCGISSTLSTYEKMQNKFKEELNKLCEGKEYAFSFTNFALIQVLPNISENIFELSRANNENQIRIEWNREKKIIVRYSEENNEIRVKYLVDVFSEWQFAEECKWCFSKEEKPLITVDDTSVVPQQIITSYTDFYSYGDNTSSKGNTLQEQKIDFFNNEKNFAECIYYKHIERGENHYQYYIRTAKLFWEIIHNTHFNEMFISFCNRLTQLLMPNNEDNIINIIITPIHYSNVLFPSYINHYVFKGKAHILTVEPKKEFRSNFVTKYSNYAYLNQQYTDQDIEIRYHFIDDQIVSGSTFYRAESLVRSLKNKFSRNNLDAGSVFYSTIVLLNRISNETQKNYIQNDRFFSLVDLKISHIRNHGDACPLCKQAFELKEIAEKSALVATKNYWNDKAVYHEVQSLKEIKTEVNNREKKQQNILYKRQFTRLKCETLLTVCSDNYASDYMQLKRELYETIRRTLANERDIDKKYELIISFTKVMSRPFLYYRENVKKFTFEFLTELLSALIYSKINNKRIIINKDNYYSLYSISLTTSKCFLEQYCLLCVLLNQLSSIGSNYLLKFENIIKIMLFVDSIKLEFEKNIETQSSIINNNIAGFGFFKCTKINDNQTYNLFGIGSIIANNYKRVICGLSGEHKIKRAEKLLEEKLFVLKDRVEKYQCSVSNEHLLQLQNECFNYFYKYSDPNDSGIFDENILNSILIEIYNYKLDNFDLEHLLKQSYYSKYEYIRNMLDFIYLVYLSHNRGDIYKNFIEIIEIIYFENCHTYLPADESKIESLLNSMKEEYTDINELKLCVISDVSSNVDSKKENYFFLESSKPNFSVSEGKLTDLFKVDEINNNNIIESINRKGFFYSNRKNKWLILLSKDSISNEHIGNIDSYLFISLSNKITVEKEQFLLLKKIIKEYRCKLTFCIENGISNGSLYAQIKKNVANNVLSSEKTQSHGKSQDLVNLYKIAKKELTNLGKESTEEEKIFTYTAINLLMNRLISNGATRNTYETYFGISNITDPLCNTMQKVNVNCYNQVDEYLNYISSESCQYIKEIHTLYSLKSGAGIGNTKIEYSCKNIANVWYMPQLLSKLDEKCSEDSAIWLIGILDLFIRNAIKHSPKENDNIITISGNKELVDTVEGKKGKKIHIFNYSFSISNKKDKTKKDSGEIHLTNQFFMKYLPSIISEKDSNYFYVKKNETEEDYTLSIFFQYVAY